MIEVNFSDRHSIGSLSERFGVSLRTLRFYEERGLLNPQHRGNRRYYNDRDVVRLQIILLAKRFGFTLQEIRELIDTRAKDSSPPRDVRDLGLASDEIEHKIDALTQQRDDLDAAIATLRLARAGQS